MLLLLGAALALNSPEFESKMRFRTLGCDVRRWNSCYAVRRTAAGCGGGSSKVIPIFSAKIITAVSSVIAETGKTLQATGRLAS